MRIRTGYSFRTAFGHLDEVMSALKEKGFTVAPITDRMSTFGFNRWNKLCKKNGMRPVFGVELGVVTALGESKPVIDYWTFLAKDNVADLNELIGLATNNPGKEPTLTYAEASAAKGVIKIAGEKCFLPAMNPRTKDLYISLSPSTPIGLVRDAQAKKFKFWAQSDNSYPRESDADTYRVVLGRNASDQTYPMHILDDKELIEVLLVNHYEDGLIKFIATALTNRKVGLEACKAQLQKATLLRPEKPKTLRQMCLDGAKRLKCDLRRLTYMRRLDKELALIADKKFEDYFYIIADLVNFAKTKMIVGPARGSSCGSLVCYLLGITTVDPIPYDLIFERFIDVNRTDLPDIDIDFSDQHRNLVFDYCETKYGKDHVARLGTVSLFRPKSAIHQAAKQFGIPYWKTDKVTDNIIERSGGDSRALQTLEDTLRDTDAGKKLLNEHPEIAIAARMEGHPNSASQHAAGIVITERPVAEYVAVDKRTSSLMCDKKDAEDYNLLKIDALGLTQLSIFERTLELIGVKKKDFNKFLVDLPLDDPAAFRVLNEGKFSGVFQFMGGALQSLAKQFIINDLEDIVAITALARPGPMASGGANTWAKRRVGKERVSYPHPLFEPHLKGTLGVVMYQEQVMTIGREIGDLTWEDVTELRKAMSKSLGKEYFDKYGDRWKKAASKKGIPDGVLNKVWDDLCAYGSWAFNRSHSVAYGIVSYWCCWLKAHYATEFAAATLDAETDPLRQIQILRELSDEGVDYVPLDAVHSTDRWEVTQKGDRSILVGPLTQIVGFGPAKVSEILLSRKEGKELRPSIAKPLAAAKTLIDSLYPVADRIKQLAPDLPAIGIVSKVWKIKDVQCGVDGSVVIIAVVRKIAPKDENEAVNVAKRGGRVLVGPTKAINMFFVDDTDEIFCKINREQYDELGKDVIERGRPGRSIYAVKGTVPRGFRMISVRSIKFIGDMEDYDASHSDGRHPKQQPTDGFIVG